MTSLADTLTNYNARLRAGMGRSALPDFPPYLTKALEEIRHHFDKIGADEIVSTQKDWIYWVALAIRTHEGNDWGSLTRRETHNIARCLPFGEPPLLARADLLQSFLEHCRREGNRRLCATLVGIYLLNFSADSDGIARLGNWLAHQVDRWGLDWRIHHKSYDLFAATGPSAIAREALRSPFDTHSFLKKMKMDGLLLHKGFVPAALSEAITLYRRSASQLNSSNAEVMLGRLLEWVIDPQDNKFRHASLRQKFMESLILPWADRQQPSIEVQKLTQSFLLKHFGDPRLPSHQAEWRLIDPAALRVFYRWLAKQSVEQFLRVVDELAIDHQWRYRRAFWESYLRHGFIEDAWVAFAPHGMRKIRDIAARNADDLSWRSCATLDGSWDKKHAVLILKIGDLMIADFSHSGKCRLWRDGNKKKPSPYQQSYGRDSLMHAQADWEFVHSGSEKYHWQGQVSERISYVTGISINREEFNPWRR